ncbi:MAG: LD-carboxypeptidase [Rhizobacter sp.]|nr:LD-carboxypeptidase [Ferruginibacter sp.]
MKRKDFLSSVGIAAMAAGAISLKLGESEKKIIIPPFLNPGDTIGITSPAGYITTEEIQSSVNKIREWGFNVSIGSTIGKRDFTFGGTDRERAADLQQMLDNTNIKAILCARGGYGAVRIIDQLDFKKFKKDPKWVIGFSDITVLHGHINRNCHVATIHSKMCNSFPDDWTKAEPIQIETIESIGHCLSGRKMNYSAFSNVKNKPGTATGELVGGNLRTIESLAGSNSDICTKNKILFVEDTGEYLYSIDRMFWNLKRSGKLHELKGLIIGGFKVKKDDSGDEFGKTVEEIVLEKIKDYKYPVCFDFPVGHQRNNFSLKCGVQHELVVEQNESRLMEV